MATKYGTFAEPPSHSVGEPYRDRLPRSDREKGLNFKAHTPKMGKTAVKGTTISEFVPIWSGEPYERNNKELREKRMKEMEKRQSEPFKPASYSEKSVGLGNYYGTIGPKLEHLAERDMKKDFADRLETLKQPLKPNLYTQPVKKGGFGVPGTHIGGKIPKSMKDPMSEKVGDEFKYAADIYDGIRMRDREDMKKHHEALAKQGHPGPFRPANPQKKGGPGTAMKFRTVAQRAEGTGTEFKYMEQGPDPKKPPKREIVPWSPASIPKKGEPGAINKFPEHQADPLAEKIARRKAEKEAHQKKNVGAGYFIPSSTPKSDVTASVMRMNIGRRR